MKLKLSIQKTVDENAAVYFEIAKKAKKKLQGARKTLEEFNKKQENTSNEEVEVKSSITKISREKKLWFEKFKWFISSDGYLVVGARDATTNEILVKKHVVEGDIIFHTDMAGSPFVIVKKDNSDVKRLVSKEFDYVGSFSEQTIAEAAAFTFFHSKAWKLGLGSSSVFWVNPDQVTKEANSGEYMSKGSFMIRGKTNYVDPYLPFACGIISENFVGENGRFFMAGPLPAVKTLCEHFIEVEQGRDKSSLVAKSINAFLKEREGLVVDLDTIIASLPSGGSQVKKVRKRKQDLKSKKKK